MYSPWIWIGLKSYILVIQKLNNSETWMETDETDFKDNYTEISVDDDANGNPVVILKKIGFDFYLKLTQNTSFQGQDLSNISSHFLFGFWKKIDGRFKLFVFKEHEFG